MLQTWVTKLQHSLDYSLQSETTHALFPLRGVDLEKPGNADSLVIGIQLYIKMRNVTGQFPLHSPD